MDLTHIPGAEGYAPTPESAHLQISTDLFSGPLDLLLHLIDKNAIDIFDIPIAQIAEEYAKTLRQLQESNQIDLDIAGEFVFMAAELAHIKSKMLLPKPIQKNNAANGDDNGLNVLIEDGTEADPRRALVQKLLEYRRYKEAAQKLDGMPQLGRDLFGRHNNAIDDIGLDVDVADLPINLQLAPIETMELARSFYRVMQKAGRKRVHEVTAEHLSIRARIGDIVDLYRHQPHASFSQILASLSVQNTPQKIICFLALLEMARLKILVLQQETTDVLCSDEKNLEIHVTVRPEFAVDEDNRLLLDTVQDFD